MSPTTASSHPVCRYGVLARSGSGRHQVADEDEGLTGSDGGPGALVPVGQARGDDQLSAAADPHALHALVPAGDDMPGAELELQRVAPVPARVEFLAGRLRDPDVVPPDHVALVRLGTVTLPDIGDLQLGRRLAAGKVDLGPADAHICLFRFVGSAGPRPSGPGPLRQSGPVRGQSGVRSAREAVYFTAG